MLSQGKLKRSICLLLTAFIIASSILIFQTGFYRRLPISKLTSGADPQIPPKPVYKATPDPPPPIDDNFPLAASAKSPSELPPIPKWNTPPKPHVPENTPLFIGFTRNWRLLQQVVVSYITAGWPPNDIYVVDNTGTMHSNRNGLLTLQNPFYLDYRRLTTVLGVNVLSTPTLFTFAQLQNFYVYTALEKKWDTYFWAHMDTVVISDEEIEEPYQSLYKRAVAIMRESMVPSYGSLATRWFAYDALALVRTQAFVDVGGWDTMIPFYMTDCDMHERLWMRDFMIEDAKAGLIYDVSSSLDDLKILYERHPDGNGAKKDDISRNSPTYQDLLHKLDDMQRSKHEDHGGRNTWQARQRGGQGDPFYRDAEGFEKGIQMTMDLGRHVFEEKWGRGPCDIRDAGLVEGDAWRVLPEWETAKVQAQAKADKEKDERDKRKQEADEAKRKTE